MKIRFNFNGFLRSLNTHRVFGVGLGTALGSVGVLAARNYLDMTLPHAGAIGSIAQTYYDAFLVPAAQAALPPAIIAAAYGRPPTIPPDPPKP